MVFGIQHFSIHDGAGIRTNVFLMGCPMRCVWCHNPEGMSAVARLSFVPDRCSGCGKCFEVCPEVHALENGVHVLRREFCRHCFKCAGACAGHALEQVGREMDVGEVTDAVVRDKRYYDATGGGVTLTGGEPMTQFGFSVAILEACRAAGIDTAIETCGAARTGDYGRILPLVDTFLFDIKETDPNKHLEFTGAESGLVLRNLSFLSGRGARIILRCPIIPGLNDRPEHLTAIAELSRRYPGVEGAEIMPYHKLGVSKAARMGLAAQELYEQPSQDTVESWKNAIAAAGGKIMKY